MDKILGVVGSVPNTSARNDDDFADRLSYRYTAAMLVVFAVVVSTKQYVGEPITCWVPAHFSGSWEEYANSYCWIKNTYYLPYEEYIPHEHEPEKRDMVPYYQWVPLIMLTQALLFYLPCLFWRTMNSRSGIDVNNIVESGESFQNINHAGTKDTILKNMTDQMHRFLDSRHTVENPGCTVSLKHCLSRTCCVACGRRQGNYLVTLYLVTKVLYIVNVLGQLFMLNVFLDTQFHTYGFDVITALINGEDWTESPRFPRVTMCDFKIRRLGNVQRYTVQCVLPINLFNEKIYLLIWFWMVFVAVLTCITLLQWALRSSLKRDQERYVQKHLSLVQKSEVLDEEDVRAFTREYLKPDGVFVLRLVDINTNAITATEFTNSLYEQFIASENEKHHRDEEGEMDEDSEKKRLPVA